MAVLCVGWAQAKPVTNWQLQGLNEPQSRNVSIYLDNQRFDCQSLKTANSQQRQALRKQVRLALQPFGLFNPTTAINIPPDSDCDQLSLTIEPGPVTRITQLNLEVTGPGVEETVWQEAASEHGLKIGQPLKQPAYEALKKQWQNLASELFFQNARFTTQQLRVNADANEAAIELSFDTGQRFRLNQVIVEETPAVLDQALLLKMLPFKSGQYISRSELYAAQQKLNSTGYFSSVLFDVREDEYLTATVDLVVMLTPASKFDYAAGVGYSTDAGAKASLMYSNHRVNGLGHQYRFNIQASELANDLTMNYKIPSRNRPSGKWYGIHVAYKDEQTDQVEREIRKWGASETRIQGERWQNINFIDWIQESFDTGVARGKTLLYVPGTSWSLTDTDDVSRPSQGYKLQAEFKLASEDLLSDASFAQLNVNGKYIHSFEQGSRLLYRVQLGSTATSDFEQLPTSYRFYTGGDQSIRGYDYEQISPLNAAGDAIGGKHLLAGSIEYEHPLAEQWAAAVFTDFGDAFSESFDLKQSVGAGVRWFSPIGPIRVDLAKPISESSSSYRLHITVGPDL